jgi:hypothetical protein
MESIQIKDFLEKLNSGNLKPSARLLGFVKKSDKGSEVLFAFKHDLTNWIAIPESMIESVNILKNIPDEKNILTLVKLHLKIPSGPEAKILHDLLAVLSAKVNKYHKIKWIKKMLFGEGMIGSHGMHPMEYHLEGKCGHHWKNEHEHYHH